MRCPWQPLRGIALAGAAISFNFALLGLASLAIGMTTISAQLIVPFAAQLANPNERGKVVGMVMSGLFIGILLARTVSGVVGASLGWRAMYAIASILMILLAVVLPRSLPKSRLSLQLSYVKLMASSNTAVSIIVFQLKKYPKSIS